MDKLSELTHGAKIVLGAAIAFLIVSFFNWQEVDLGPIGEAGVSMWNGVGWIAGLLAIALIVWQAVRLANIELEIGVGPAMVTAALALLLVLFTFIKFITDGEFRTFWAWLGLILSIVVAVGAWMNMKASGESMQAMMDRFQTREPAAPAAAAPAPPAPPPAAPPAEPESSPPPAAGDDGGDEHRHS